MHPALLNAYATMLPRLQAEEALRAHRVAVAADPAYKAPDRRRIISEFAQTAMAGGHRVQQSIGSALQALGLPVIRSRGKGSPE